MPKKIPPASPSKWPIKYGRQNGLENLYFLDISASNFNINLLFVSNLSFDS